MTALDLLQVTSSSEETLPQSQFDQIVTCMEQENIDEAMQLIENALTKGIYDIRLIAYYLYAHFFTHGIHSFLDVFPQLTNLIKDQWAILKPANKKDKQVQNSLSWLVLNIVNKLKYCEKLAKTGKTHPIWEMSTHNISSRQLKEIVGALQEFQEFFQEKWPRSSTQDRLQHLLQITDNMKVFVVDEPEEKIEAAAPVPSEEASPVVEKVKEPIQEDAPLAPPLAEPPIEPALSARDKNVSEMSEEMKMLLEKLAVFEILTRKQQFLKAALVAKDIDQLIANFDPLIYLPKIFANYFSLIAKNIESLSKEWENKETLQLKYLEKLYKTDANLFINW